MQVTDVLDIASGDLGTLERPVMLVGLEGWFDVAGAATQAVAAFTNQDHAVTVGSIDPDPFYDFTQHRPHVTVDDGVRDMVWPSNEFVLHRHVSGPAHRDILVASAGVRVVIDPQGRVHAIFTSPFDAGSIARTLAGVMESSS